MKNRIVEGDVVNVHFENLVSLFSYTVLYMPCDAGDSWRLKSDDEKIVYVQSFCVMEKTGWRR